MLKNTLTLILDGLINLIVVLSPDGAWLLSDPVCWITGYAHVTLVVMGISMICAIQFYQVIHYMGVAYIKYMNIKKFIFYLIRIFVSFLLISEKFINFSVLPSASS